MGDEYVQKLVSEYLQKLFSFIQNKISNKVERYYIIFKSCHQKDSSLC